MTMRMTVYKEVNIQEQGLLQGSTRAEVGAILSKYCDNCNCHHHRHHGDHDQPSAYRLTIYRYAIIVSFSKYR